MIRPAPALLAALTISAAAAPAAAEAPWSVDRRHPAPQARTVPSPQAEERGSASAFGVVADGALWFWRNVLSPVDGPTCGFHPTCSGYARQAVRRHGWLLGGAMAADRIMRNHAAPDDYALRRVHGVLRMVDPVPP